QIARVGEQAVVRGDEPLVEDRPKGRRDLRPGALYVRGYLRRLLDDLVLKAGVELHVPRLVDLLGGKEGHLLLARPRADEPGELRRDPLLGDHQRAEHERQQRPVLHRGPLLPVDGQVDLPGIPLTLLPVAVERLRVVEVDLPSRHEGFLARTIADLACAWTRWVSSISMPSRPAAASASRNSRSVSAPAMQPV